MKILFNKEAGDSSELLAVTGINDASLDIAQFWPYIRMATREIVKIIGEANYQKGVVAYEAHDFEDEFLQLLRYPIALDAVRKIAPLTDLKITENGRQFRSDDHHKAPWQWQIEKSDAENEKAYYRTLDELISFIVDADDMEESEYMQQFTGLFVPNIREFEKYMNINNSHLLYYKLAPSMRAFEEDEIIARVGNKFLEYKNQKNTRIYRLIQNACVHHAMADGIKKLSLQLFPEGLMKAEVEKKKSASGYDVEATALYYEKKADVYLLSLEQEVSKGKTDFVPREKINFSKDDGFVSL
jgi:hypothetical protein